MFHDNFVEQQVMHEGTDRLNHTIAHDRDRAALAYTHGEYRNAAYRGGGGGGGSNDPGEDDRRYGYVDLKIGSPLRTVHPSPLRSDQVILVLSLFGSELNMTTFWDLRDELERVLMVKYNKEFNKTDWDLSDTRGDVALTAPLPGFGGKSAAAAAATATVDSAHKAPESPRGGGVNSGSNSDDFSSRSAAVRVAMRVCQYLSIDPDTAKVNVGIRVNRPKMHAKLAHTSTYRNECFVVVAFGAPVKVVLRRRGPGGGGGGGGGGGPSFNVDLPSNSALAIMVGVSAQGWTYGVKNMSAEEGRGGSPNGSSVLPSRTETVTVLVSGSCPAIRRAFDAPIAAIPYRPRHPSHEPDPAVYGVGRGSTPVIQDGVRRVSVASDVSSSSNYTIDDDSHAVSGRNAWKQDHHHRSTGHPLLAEGGSPYDPKDWCSGAGDDPYLQSPG